MGCEVRLRFSKGENGDERERGEMVLRTGVAGDAEAAVAGDASDIPREGVETKTDAIGGPLDMKEKIFLMKKKGTFFFGRKCIPQHLCESDEFFIVVD